MRNGIALHGEVAADALPLGVSRVGGQPDLPPQVAWPRRDGRPLAFIVQIDLAQAQPYDRDGRLPERGWLYLFYDAQEQPWGFDLKDADGKRLLFHEGDASELATCRFPDDLDAEYRFAPAPLAFASCAQLPDPESVLADYDLDDNERERLFELREEIGDGESQLLGHSYNVQSGQELECELVSNGLYCGDSSGYQDPRRKELEGNAPHWSLLMQIASDEEKGMMWGDCGLLYLWIREQDLREHRFDRTWLILQCS
ncbi:hypothetical protein ASD69_07260 [Lysobacter sp. Root604]|nr:hypothetical protein ASD69_07260 [Lysobacter sp. Root604]